MSFFAEIAATRGPLYLRFKRRYHLRGGHCGVDLPNPTRSVNFPFFTFQSKNKIVQQLQSPEVQRLWLPVTCINFCFAKSEARSLPQSGMPTSYSCSLGGTSCVSPCSVRVQISFKEPNKCFVRNILPLLLRRV